MKHAILNGTNKAALCAVLVSLAGSLLATDWYVNCGDGLGDNAWDGSAKIHEPGTLHGPKKTLQGAMSIPDLADGHVVHVAAGVYAEDGYWDGYNTNRVYISKAISLVADEGRDLTVIEGALAEGTDDGNGDGAVRCVKMTKTTASVRGFTIRNGRTKGGNAAWENAAGCVHGGTIVDCIVTNGNAAYRGVIGGPDTTTAIGCLVYGPERKNVARNEQYVVSGTTVNGYNSVFYDFSGGAYGFNNSNGTFVNCTFPNGCPGGGTTYNSFVRYAGPKMTLVNCRYATFVSGAVCDEQCKVVSVADAKLDPATYRPMEGSLLIDDGSKEIYDTFFDSAFKDDFAAYDFGMTARVKGETIDIGAGEFDWTASVAAALASDVRFSLSSVPASAFVSGAGAVVLLAGTTASGAWSTPSGAIVSNGYSFVAVASGNAVLSVFLDGATTPVCRLTAEDGETTLAYAAMKHAVSLVVTGTDGAVSIRQFGTDAPTAWFVEEDGDDEADGKTLGTAKRTIAEALKLATSGSVVYVGPGTYASGLMTNSFTGQEGVTAYASNRVVVASGVELFGYRGAGVTAIEGFKSSQNASGCGTDAVRGAYVEAGGVLRGFTIRNCATQAERTSKEAWQEVINGGGVVTADNAAVVDCVISNNVAGYRGGGVGSDKVGNSGNYIRCLIVGNDSVDQTSPGGQYGNYFNCVFDGSGATVYSSGTKFVNCTCLNGAKLRGKAQIKVYNSIVGDGGKGDFMRCISTGPQPATGSVFADEYVLNAWNIAESLDGFSRPTAGAIAVDSGDVNHYVTNFPAAWIRFADLDFAGGQRIYNGKIDIGAGERDWRGDYAATLGRTARATVILATPGVTNAVNGVVLADGARLEADLHVDAGATVLLQPVVSGSGSLGVSVNGVDISADADGVYRFIASDMDRIVFSFAGEGEATIGGISRARGILLIVR